MARAASTNSGDKDREDQAPDYSTPEAFGGQPPADPPGVSRNADNTISSPPSTVSVQRYAPAEGWEVGNAAPKDRYVEVDAQGNTVGKLLDEPPEGKYARQVTAKGDTITQAIADQLAALDG